MTRKIYLAGHRGLVGSALKRALEQRGEHIITRTHDELDLRNQADTRFFFAAERPDIVYLAAARVGGILANAENQAAFLLENLQIACNVIESAYEFGTKKLLFLGSSCIYPKNALQPIPETALLTGALEPTNEGYALAKIAGLKLCEFYNKQYGAAFISAMPCNLYGVGDNFDPRNSHIIPALLRRFHEAKQAGAQSVTLWGTGTPRREFLFADDLARACLLLMDDYSDPEPVNIGSGEEYTIAETAEIVAKIVGYPGAIHFDSSYPDGTMRKVVDSSKIRAMGWQPLKSFEEGIRQSYEWYCNSRRNPL